MVTDRGENFVGKDINLNILECKYVFVIMPNCDTTHINLNILECKYESNKLMNFYATY